MALSGIEIYKLLPQTNCKDCGFPTCLAFAMKLASKQVELAKCPHVSEESKAKLAEASAPPVRPFKIKSNGYAVEAGNEVVLFRHNKQFYSRPGLFVRVWDTLTPQEIQEKVEPVDQFKTEYVGIELHMDGIAVQADGGDFGQAVAAVRQATKLPLILIGDKDQIREGLQHLGEDEVPLLGLATDENWQEMASLASEHGFPLAVEANNIDQAVALVKNVTDAGVKDIVISPTQRSMHGTLIANTITRRMALKENFRPLGYPILNFPGDVGDPNREINLAAQAIGKYAGFIVMDHFEPATAYPLLVLRENIYTNPQEPIQVTPGIYEINDPSSGDPVLVTTNFSITYFSVANEVESVGIPAWLLVSDAEGMSVLTAWAAGKFDAVSIARDVKEFDAASKLDGEMHIVLPGHVAVLSGELEEELPDWTVKVGPREAVDLPNYMKQVL
ncbi:MAG: acetyl-CoA decarbonylase/synthase complex subunit gamma [Anaerolineales bacterium]